MGGLDDQTIYTEETGESNGLKTNIWLFHKTCRPL